MFWLICGVVLFIAAALWDAHRESKKKADAEWKEFPGLKTERDEYSEFINSVTADQFTEYAKSKKIR